MSFCQKHGREQDGVTCKECYIDELEKEIERLKMTPVCAGDIKRIVAERDEAEAQTKRLFQKLELLGSLQRAFREPERTIVCDILANGCLLPDPEGKRYCKYEDACKAIDLLKEEQKSESEA